MSNRKRKATILFDKLIGKPIFGLLSKSKKAREINKKEIKNILLIRPGGIGDYLLNIPTFKELKRSFPKAKTTLLIFKRNEFCKQFYDNFDTIITIDKPGNLMKFLFSKKNYDLCIDFDQNRKIPSILAMKSKAKYKIGFDNSGKGKAYDFAVEYKSNEYESQCFLNLLKPLNIIKTVSEKDLILIENKPSKNKTGIYAAAMKEENRLSVQKWKEIIEKSGKNKEYYFFGGPKDKERYDLLENELPGFKIQRRDGKSSLKESIKEISKMQSFISEDGGVYHMAVCTGVPTTSYWLHGKDNMAKWKSPLSKHKGVLLK